MPSGGESGDGGGLFAQNEATAMTGRRHRVLEVGLDFQSGRTKTTPALSSVVHGCPTAAAVSASEGVRF